MSPDADELAGLLSDGLDLCVRARTMDDAERAAWEAACKNGEAGGTVSATMALWVRDQYDRDLAAWEARAKAALGRTPPFAFALSPADGDEQ